MDCEGKPLPQHVRPFGVGAAASVSVSTQAKGVNGGAGDEDLAAGDDVVYVRRRVKAQVNVDHDVDVIVKTTCRELL